MESHLLLWYPAFLLYQQRGGLQHREANLHAGLRAGNNKSGLFYVIRKAFAFCPMSS